MSVHTVTCTLHARRRWFFSTYSIIQTAELWLHMNVQHHIMAVLWQRR